MDALTAVIKTQVVFNQGLPVVRNSVSALLSIEKIVDNNPVAIGWTTEVGVVDQIAIVKAGVVLNDDTKPPTVGTSVLRLKDGDAAVLGRVEEGVSMNNIPLTKYPVGLIETNSTSPTCLLYTSPSPRDRG